MFAGSGACRVRVHGTAAVQQVRGERHERLVGGIRFPRRHGPDKRGAGAGCQVSHLHDQRAPVVPVQQRLPVRFDVRQLQQLVSGHVPVVGAHQQRGVQPVGRGAGQSAHARSRLVGPHAHRRREKTKKKKKNFKTSERRERTRRTNVIGSVRITSRNRP